jgi:hypothetical protein
MKIDSLVISLQDILFLIGMQARSGELVLETGNNIGTILFHKGNIVQAFSPYSRAFGDFMVEEGLISEAELIETLQFQKKSDYVPLGGLLLKAAKVTFDVIERLVSEQIRQSIKEFLSWKNLTATFVEKDIQPYDSICLPVHEFIGQESIASAATFLSRETPQREPSSSSATSSLA